MGCSIGEIIIVMVIAALVAKPQDLKYLIRQFHAIKLLIQRTYMSIIADIDLDQQHQQSRSNYINNRKLSNSKRNKQQKNSLYKTQEQCQQMNFYLEKIAKLEGVAYSGRYDLASIKKKYYVLLRSRNIKKGHKATKRRKPREIL